MSKIMNKDYQFSKCSSDYWSFNQTPFYNAKQVSIYKTKDGEVIARVVKEDGKEEILVNK